MAGGGNARASKIEADGALIRSGLPGYTGTLEANMDQAPWAYDSGIMTFATLVDADNGRFVAPCDLEIKGAVGTVKTVVSATGGGALDIGNSGDDDAYLSAYAVATTLATDAVFTITATEFTETSITKGALVGFGLDIAVAAGGVIWVSLVVAPR